MMVGKRGRASKNPMRRTTSMTELSPPDVLAVVVEEEEAMVVGQPDGGDRRQDWLAACGGGGASAEQDWLAAYRARAAPARAGLRRNSADYSAAETAAFLRTPFSVDDMAGQPKCPPFRPVIFHDGRLVCRPSPLMSLVILLWLPLGVLVAFVRIAVGILVPIHIAPRIAPYFGGAVITHGRAPTLASASAADGSPSGVLFVCTHRTLMDPVILATVLGRRVAAVTYSISRLSQILSPIPTVQLTRDRDVDAARMRAELSRGDVAVCPEGTTCREPFLLRFSALFAELSDRIVPVAMNYHVGLFHPTTARGWKAMDPIFFFMNPRPVYEVTFLNQLPAEATCAAGKSPVDVANYVQRILAATLGFECTSLTRKDKYRVLVGNDGIVNAKPTTATEPAWQHRVKEALGFLLH